MTYKTILVPHDGRDLAKEIYYEMKKIAQKLLDSKKKQCEDNGVSVETAVSYGNVSGSILDLIKSKNADLVVMGTTGLSGISKIKVLGSVARNISEKSPCPVLLVH
jgi:nucleotide-binding universal stress UspA family protein